MANGDTPDASKVSSFEKEAAPRRTAFKPFPSALRDTSNEVSSTSARVRALPKATASSSIRCWAATDTFDEDDASRARNMRLSLNLSSSSATP